MAKSKQPQLESADELLQGFVDIANKSGNGRQVIFAHDLRKHTYGIRIPWIVFQWLIGGSSILPASRVLGLSGASGSYKSTMVSELGTWYIVDGGLHIPIDNESKTSATMYESLARGYNMLSPRRSFTETESVDEWQKKVSDSIAFAREKLVGRPMGKRIPVLISVDSLMGKSTEEEQDAIKKEGDAQARSYPVAAAKVTKFMEAMNLIGLTVNFLGVRHLKEKIDQQGHGDKMKEKGAVAFQFACSLNIRMQKVMARNAAEHDAFPIKGPAIQGYTLKFKTEKSCVGEDKREIEVDVLWQFVPKEMWAKYVKDTLDVDLDISQMDARIQVMKYDWDGALGKLLWTKKYSEKGKDYKWEIDRLNEAIYFTQGKAGMVQCDVFDPENEISWTEFGRRIRESPEIAKKVQDFLGITHYAHIQEAEIE